MKNNVEISVITPIYKGKQYINGLFSMIQKNSELFEKNKVELVLVNDYPIEPLIVDEDVDFNFKLKIIENRSNLGIQASRINGLNVASGKYIVFLDQDDKISDTALFSQYSKIGDNSAIISNGFYEDDLKNKIKLFRNFKQQKFVNDFKYYFYFGNLIASPGMVLIKKSAIPMIWMKNIMKINGADDWLLWVLFLKSGDKFVINNEFLYTHVNNENNTSDDEEQMLLSSKEALEILKETCHFRKQYISVYSRRLKMRELYIDNCFFKKVIQYLLNIDILYYIIKFKMAI